MVLVSEEVTTIYRYPSAGSYLRILSASYYNIIVSKSDIEKNLLFLSVEWPEPQRPAHG